MMGSKYLFISLRSRALQRISPDTGIKGTVNHLLIHKHKPLIPDQGQSD
jgi:hypothetical protein